MALLVSLAPAAAGAQNDPMARPVAPNVEVAPVYEPAVEAVWRASLTFRRQWRRLVADRMRVVIRAEGKPRNAVTEASTEIVYRPGTTSIAFVSLPPSRDFPRLLAHELEHVIEQLDGVELRAHVHAGVVWSGPSARFETVRAVEAGFRVAREVAAAARTARTGRPAPLEERPVRLVQQETQTSPMAARTSRVSADGRYVVFVSSARLVAEDRDGRRDVYVYDRLTGRYSRESGAADGDADGESWSADISGDGRHVVFESEAGNLVRPAITAGNPHIYLRARDTGKTRLLTTDGDGAPVRAASRNPVISADGTVVAFESAARDLVSHTTGKSMPAGIYAIRLADGRRTRVDVDCSGRTDGQGMTPAISADGRLVAFASKGRLADADGRAAAKPPATLAAQVYIRDLESNVLTLVSRNRAGGFPNAASYDPAISGDGRYVAFVSEADDVGAGARRGRGQIYLHERATGSTVLVSRTSSNRPADGSSLRPALSSDGSVIAFQSIASNLDCSRQCSRNERDSNLLWDVFVHDRATGRTRQATTGSDWLAGGRAPSLDAAGRVLALASMHAIDDGDETYDEDLYVLPARPAAVQVRGLDVPESPGTGVR